MEKTLDDYLLHYGPELGRKVLTHMRPLHRPSVDSPAEIELLRAPYPMQMHAITATIKQLNRSPAVQIVGECGVGKGVPENWPVLTPSGWRAVKSLKIGDDVFGSNGTPTKVTGVFPRGMQPCFKVTFDDSSEVICDSDHLWNVKSRDDRVSGAKWRTISTESLAKSDLRINKGRSFRWSIPMCSPVQFKEAKLPLDPYVLGVLLGDATLKCAMIWKKPDEFMAQEVNRRLPPGDKVVQRGFQGDCPVWAIEDSRGGSYTSQTRTAITSLGLYGKLSHQKFIPRKYLFASEQQRRDLLAGLMDTDGCSQTTSGLYCTTSSFLKVGVRFLVESLGGTVAERYIQEPKYVWNGEIRTGKPAWTLYCTLPGGDNLFKSPVKASKQRASKHHHCRKIVSIEPVSPARTVCIKVAAEDGLFLTNNCIVTHNTILGMASVEGHSRGKPYRAIVMCPPHLVEKHQRELQETIPGVSAHIIESIKELRELASGDAGSSEWYIISASNAKLGPGWTPVEPKGAKLEKSGLAKLYSICHACHEIQWKSEEAETPHKPDWHRKEPRFCQSCGTPMFQWGGPGKFHRWPLANYIHKKMPGQFDYFICDEVHQTKSVDSLIGESMGTICACVKKTIVLTGTLIGGYSEHIRSILFRANPQALLKHDMGWDNEGEFINRYGRYEIKEVITTKTNRKGRVSSTTKRTKKVRPGIMPTLFGDMLIDNTVFLSLADVAANLPSMTEFTIPVDMSDELREAYRYVEEEIKSVVEACLAEGNVKPIPVMLQTLMGYTDRPYGWGTITYAGEMPGERIPICQAPDLDESTTFPKEDQLLNILLDNHARGRQCWIFTTMTGVRDVCERLQEKIEAAGLRCGILRAEKVPTKDRERWIAENGPRYDVIISHPKPVETGLDLFDKRGGHNFATLIFYLTGYDTFVMRQASRRGYRLGQPLECENYYMFYRGTLQETAMSLMGQKLAASLALEGNFSSEGLIAMIGDDSSSIAMELAKSLARGLEEVDVSQSWSKIAIPVGEVRRRQDVPVAIEAKPAELVTVGDRIAALRAQNKRNPLKVCE